LTSEPISPAALREHDLQGLFFPIIDMEAPALAPAAELMQQVATLLAQGLCVGFHCKAGLGRTGTMLAAQLVWEGSEAGAALAQVRHIEPGWVQSDRQERFLCEFHDWLQQRRLTPKSPL
jgi:atypical dual specificity phosphatase